MPCRVWLYGGGIIEAHRAAGWTHALRIGQEWLMHGGTSFKIFAMDEGCMVEVYEGVAP